MNPAAYLFVKFRKSWGPAWRLTPRVGIAMPFWIIGVMGFGDLLYPDNIIIFCLNCLLLLALLYAIVYLAMPPKYVTRHISQWDQRYGHTTAFWSFLYFFSGLLAGALILFLRT